MRKSVTDGKKLNTSYVPNLAGSTSCLSENHMCAWLSVLSMYKKKDIHTYHLLKSCYDETEEKTYFEDLRIFKNKKGVHTKTLVEWLKTVGKSIKKVKIPDGNNGIEFVKDNLEVDCFYICLLENIHGETTHSIGLETSSVCITINDSGDRYPFDNGKGLDKSLDNVKCIRLSALGQLL